MRVNAGSAQNQGIERIPLFPEFQVGRIRLQAFQSKQPYIRLERQRKNHIVRLFQRFGEWHNLLR